MRPAVILLVVTGGLALVACGGNDTTVDPGPEPEACTAPPAPGTGEATYYDANGTGNCSFDPSPGDLMVAAMNAPDYDHAAWCGGCVEVTGPTGAVTVRIVDQCPGCAKGDLDLSQEAFARIAKLSAGRVPITWHEVACNVQGPIAYQFKDGSSEFYTAIQIRNHRYPITKVESRDSTGTWHAIPRVDYNYFIPQDALGPGPFALRVTDTRGHSLEDPAVPLAATQTKPGAAQFPTCL